MRLAVAGMWVALTVSGPLYAHQQDDQEWVGWEGEQPGVLQELVNILVTPAYADARISVDGNYRVIRSNGLPDHDTGRFPNAGNPHQIQEALKTYRVPRNPEYRVQATRLGLWPFGVAVNGVPFDPGAAEFWRRDFYSGWQYEALGGAVNLGVDRNNAHVQPDGSYHYHGMPTGLLDRFSDSTVPILLGYAADGFPIYGPYGYRDAENSASGMHKLNSSYRVKSGTRPDGPGGRYDGSFVQDYEYVAGLGDLDDCNGRTGVTREYPDGTYYYVITDRFPFIPRCFHGTPDRSFMRGPGGNGGLGRPAGGSGRRAGFGSQDVMGASGGRGSANGPRDGHRPPQEAINACEGHTEGDQVSFVTPHGHEVSGICEVRDGMLFVIPRRR